MTDTVRDAVFGNVGTMISFRVSADDSPILAKQFEPQFEAQDLLQMHNRHFIINMVIGGEKAPAFSATTLTLPPEQIDNSALIIENTRRNYSRPRAEVEIEIDAAIRMQQQGAQAAKPQPQSQAQARQWPVDTGAIAVGQVIGSGPSPQPSDSPAEDKPKRKRTRTRKRKPAGTEPKAE